MWLDVTREQSGTIEFEEWFEKIGTTRFHDLLDLIVAWIVEETVIVQVSLVELDWAAIVTKHKLLERHEAHVPRVTLFVGHESGD